MIKKIHLIVAFCVFVSVSGSFTANAQSDNTQKTLPDLEVKLQDDTTVNLSKLKGKVVLLDFWYRGCAPCLQAIPELIALQEEFKEDLVIIGINNYDFREDVVEYIKYKKMNYSSTYTTGQKISKALNVTIAGYPTTILYDRDGNLIKMDAGYSKSGMRSLRSAIKKAVNKV